MARKYDYIERAYGLVYTAGQRVRFVETSRMGKATTGAVMHPRRSHEHYVQVRFDGETRGSLCHPDSLAPEEPTPTHPTVSSER